jgi:hypothetical protein
MFVAVIDWNLWLSNWWNHCSISWWMNLSSKWLCKLSIQSVLGHRKPTPYTQNPSTARRWEFGMPCSLLNSQVWFLVQLSQHWWISVNTGWVLCPSNKGWEPKMAFIRKMVPHSTHVGEYWLTHICISVKIMWWAGACGLHVLWAYPSLLLHVDYHKDPYCLDKLKVNTKQKLRLFKRGNSFHDDQLCYSLAGTVYPVNLNALRKLVQ